MNNQAALTGGVQFGQMVVIFGAGCISLVSLLAAKATVAAQHQRTDHNINILL